MLIDSSIFFRACRVPIGFLRILAAASGLFASASQSLGADKALQQRIAELDNTLEADKKSVPHANYAMRFLTRLKDANGKFSPDLIDSLNQSLRQQNFGTYHGALYSLLKEISVENTSKNEQSQNNWSKQIDAFRAKVRQACIDSAPTLEFETLQVEAAGLKLKRPHSLDSSTEWTKTETGKLDSAVKLIYRWLDFRGVKEKGDLKYAQSKMEYFSRDPTPYPVLDKRFFDEKVKNILRERGVTETKRTEYRDGKVVTYVHTQPLVKPGQTTSLATRQQEIIKKLEAGNWDGGTVSGYAEELKALEKKEKRVPYWRTQANSTIAFFGACLLALEENDLSKAQINFLIADFGHTPVPALKNLERTVMADLFSAVYPTMSLPSLEKGKPISQYKIELLSGPESMDDVSNGYNLVIWLDKAHWGQKAIPDWKKAADNQYMWLSRARSAMESKDLPKALYDLRAALYYAPDAGSASAQALIKSEIRMLTKTHPELFTPSLSIRERLAKAEEQVRELESILKKTQ